eukprot:TRINITY_DN4640_c0_g1_i1.p1 TRINITY_DN4640_c0_g1~~TRINITY_DN4640_c0_g1_i1.p1  ORF type:complete len:102 (+),score=9.12 TRINITY_DN4640_c0_g1_i1:86-391(+)
MSSNVLESRSEVFICFARSSIQCAFVLLQGLLKLLCKLANSSLVLAGAPLVLAASTSCPQSVPTLSPNSASCFLTSGCVTAGTVALTATRQFLPEEAAFFA